jgi:hypothetical protein
MADCGLPRQSRRKIYKPARGGDDLHPRMSGAAFNPAANWRAPLNGFYGGPMRTTTIAGLLLVSFLLLAPVLTNAQDNSDVKFTFASDTIAPGTQITINNWQKYKKYMPYGMIELFNGKYGWKINPDVVMEVGPTIPVPLPKKYRNDTEKYSQSVKLRELGDGGYVLDGYVAGEPFPKISEPNAAVKLAYNFWYQYRPFVQAGHLAGLLVDAYDHATNSLTQSANYKLMHISDPGLPVDSPDAHGMYNAAFNEEIAPEQSKYTVALTLVPDDLTRHQENYVFLPSLRRSLRLSSSARCSPLLGSDYTPDDLSYFNGAIPEFTFKLIGEGKFLGITHFQAPPLAASDTSSFLKYLYPGSYFPRPSLSKWELRDAYVLDIQPRPEVLPHYCYQRRLLYVDKETNVALWMDLWDGHGKFWKTAIQALRPSPIPGSQGDAALAQPSGPWVVLWDMTGRHLTSAAPYGNYSQYNSDAPGRFMDAGLYASPAGLDQVMQ